MDNTPDKDSAQKPTKSAGILLITLAAYVVGGILLFSLLAQGAIMLFFGFDLTESVALMNNPESVENSKYALMLMQAITSIGAFILIPLLFIKFNDGEGFAKFFKLPDDSLRPTLMTVVILFCFMVANSIVIEWNQHLVLPEVLSAFESWAQAKEAQLKELTEYLTTFSGIHEFLIALVVIALVPAIGEELLFRGLIQKLFGKLTNNAHLAIWISAVIFGVFHFQFYGVVPRIFLGALFGYLFYWSGYLSLAMVGHFINNALTLTLVYFSQIKFIDYDLAADESSPPIYIVVLFFTAGAILLYLFRKLFSLKNA
ncbi:MAG: CPBP family intramembrane metalloprotease [Cyclobacteriaceae bacterium]